MPESKNIEKQRIGAATGILAPVLGLTCILSAVASYPQFRWTNNALSDLGIIPGITGPLFNFGLCACGLLAFSFALLGLFAYFGKNLVGKIGAAVFAAAALALVCIGIFNESFTPTHYLFSITFFVLLPISLFIITGAFAFRHQTKMALFTIIVALAAATPWIMYFIIRYVPGVAIPELTSGLAGSLWIIALGYKILKENQAKINS
ncbi:MAG: DUF998 domain-containing protein [Candidatus Bathyarchaeia archaeon]